MLTTIRNGQQFSAASLVSFCTRQTASDIAQVAPLVGRNLELVSWVYRALGAKIGKRIWWPGTSVALLTVHALHYSQFWSCNFRYIHG